MIVAYREAGAPNASADYLFLPRSAILSAIHVGWAPPGCSLSRGPITWKMQEHDQGRFTDKALGLQEFEQSLVESCRMLFHKHVARVGKYGPLGLR